MTEALKGREDVIAFLEAGKPKAKNENPTTYGNPSPSPAKPVPQPNERRIAVTVRLPENIAHALIDASAQRRKNRENAWSQQDIVAEAIERWISESPQNN